MIGGVGGSGPSSGAFKSKGGRDEKKTKSGMDANKDGAKTLEVVILRLFP